MVTSMEPDQSSPILLSLLLNPIILDNIVQYLSLQELSRISRLSTQYRNFIFQTSGVFRYLDLSRCKGAYIPALAPIDNGGHSWRAERMDENLSEDEFYAGPLRGILGRLRRKGILQDVQTLVLDGLASVTNDLIHEILTSDNYNVRILSIRACINVNQVRLQQLLRFICRPERPEGTPRLKGLYAFTDPINGRDFDLEQASSTGGGVTISDGAALGILPVSKSRNLNSNMSAWYAPTGRVIEQGSSRRSSWEETLQQCHGIIAFDAVLCSHMHEAMSICLHDASRDFLEKHKPGIPPIATVALGPEGCTGCGRAPAGAPVWGESDMFDFPLLSPPPHSGRVIDAVRPPPRARQNNINSTLKQKELEREEEPQRLIVSCNWCLVGRHCDSCHRWWCYDCYNPKKTRKLADLEALSKEGLTNYLPSRSELSTGSGAGSESGSVKHTLTQPPRATHGTTQAVKRECWDCGRVCFPCARTASRQCRRCKSEYCIWHNEGCDENTCDWCMYRSGRGSRELY